MARPMIYMTHPEHGRMPVYSEWQEVENLKNGWMIEQPNEGGYEVPAGMAIPNAASVSVDLPSEESEPALGLRASDLEIDPAPKRRGRPPKNG